MREPSLHVTRTDLEYILSKFGLNGKELDTLVKFLLQEGSNHQLTNRKRLIATYYNTKTIKKKMDTAAISDRGNTLKFLKELEIQRKVKLKFGVKPIKENTKDWGFVKEASSLCEEYCMAFNMSWEEGCKSYIAAAIDYIDRFSVMKLVTMYEFICQTQQAMTEIMSDENVDLTQEIYHEYNHIISAKTGLSNDFKSRPNKYVFFVRAATLAKSKDVSALDFVRAQFKSLEWVNGLPDPSLMIGDKAVERLQKYLFSQEGRTTKKLTNFFEKTKQWASES